MNFGIKISDNEYSDKLNKLYAFHAEHMSDLEIEREEFELKIDHKLGLNFPLNKRDELWDIKRSLDRKFWLRFFIHRIKRIFVYDLEFDTKFMEKEFRKVLTYEEVNTLLYDNNTLDMF